MHPISRLFVPVLGLLLATPAAAVKLEPLDWAAAGFETRFDFGLEVSVNCTLTDFATGCADDSGSTNARFDVTAPSVSVSGPNYQFSATIVSEVDGNAWTFGLRDVTLEVDPLAVTFLEPDAVGQFILSMIHTFSASFVAPDEPGSVATPIVFSSFDRFFSQGAFGTIRSDTLGFGDFPNTAGVEFFLPGDRLTIFFSDFFDSVFFQDEGPSYTTGCSGRVDGFDVADCVSTLELFRPVAHPAPEPALLPVALLGVGMLGRARARRR